MSHGIVTINRWSFGKMGTFGDICVGEGPRQRNMGYTLELPWRQNQRGISCIPAGVYPLRPSHYYRGDYDCWEICEVSNRDEIKIHIGNTIIDIRGCVVLGTELGWLAKNREGAPLNKWAVISSGTAFRAFMEAMKDYKDATLIITEGKG